MKKDSKYKKRCKYFFMILLCILMVSVNMASVCMAESDETEDTGYQYQGNRDYARALANRNQVFAKEDSVLTETAEKFSEETRDYTIMIYMIGSNLESRFGNGTKDIMEIRDSGVDLSKNNVLLYTGGSCRWMGKIPSDRNCVFDLSREGDEQIVAQTEKNADMGAPETLSSFLNFAYEHYPSEHYGLIFWDHGGGPIWGYGSDELFQSDSLLLREMGTAMDATPFAEKKLDWVGFDACLMGNLESMYIWKDYADYFVGSEELEPGDGWDYHFLKILNETTDPKLITSHIVDTYGAYYEGIQTDTYHPDVTLASINLEKINEVLLSLENMSVALNEETKLGKYSIIQKARSEAKSFGLLEGSRGEDDYAYDMVDLGDFAENLSITYEDLGIKLENSLEEAVVKSVSNMSAANGIAFYYPFANKGQYSEMSDVYAGISGAYSYNQFLKALSTEWLSTKTRDWKLGEMERGEEDFSLQLTEEQLENMTDAYYTVFFKDEADAYYPIVKRCRIEPDENGVLHVPLCPEVIALKTDTGDGNLWPMEQIVCDEEREVYRTQRAGLMCDSLDVWNHATGYESEYQGISVAVQGRKGEKELQVKGVASSDQSAALGGKNTVNVDHYESLYYAIRPYVPVRDTEGNLRSFSEWPDSDVVLYSYLTLDHHFGFEKKLCSDYAHDFFIQVEIKDTKGEYYATELSKVQSQEELNRVEQITEFGKVVYDVFEDHASVAVYTGSDTSVKLETTVNGVPVTEIKENAFENAYDLETIEIPDTVTVIGDSAFHECYHLQEIHLPADLKSIGNGTFSHCSSLMEVLIPEGTERIGKIAFEACASIEQLQLPSTLKLFGDGAVNYCSSLRTITMNGALDGESEGYHLIDGVLYTADEQTLMAFPAMREGSYTVLDGTREISYGTFSGAQLSEVILPESLTKIRNCAFRECPNLKVPKLPAGLVEIGNNAFGGKSRTVHFSDVKMEMGLVEIGPAVSYIGDGAFDMFISREFHVDEANPYFSSIEGNLCNGEGDTVISFAMNGLPGVKVPEGIYTLDLDRFEFLYMVDRFSYMDDYEFHGLDVIVPDSVQQFLGFTDSHMDVLSNLILHCSKDSACERYVEHFAEQNEAQEVKISHLMELEYEMYEEETDYGTMTFQIFNSYAVLCGYEGTDTVLQIPAEVQGLPVTIIGNGTDSIQKSKYQIEDALEEDIEDSEGNVIQSANIRKIILEEGIEEISDHAFQEIWLDEIVLPKTLKRIGKKAIVGSNLVFTALPESIESLGEACLDGKWEGELKIPAGVSDIKPGAFSKIKGITAVFVDDDNEIYQSIDDLIYDKTGKWLIAAPVDQENVVIPEGTELIGENAFSGMYGLQTIILPDSLVEIGNRAFQGCTSLKSVEIPDSVTALGQHAFASCFSLESVVLSENLEQIREFTFTSCSNLAEIKLPDRITEIENCAFEYCENLSKVVFSENLEIIESSAFQNCQLDIDALPESVRVLGNRAFSRRGEASEQSAIPVFHIGKNMKKVDEEAFAHYPVAAFEVAEENRFLSSVDGFLMDASGTMMYLCPTLTKETVYVPEGTKSIERGAFYTLEKETDIYIPDSVEYIGPAFVVTNQWDDEGNHEELYLVTIHCSRGSYAEKYAREKGIPYETE